MNGYGLARVGKDVVVRNPGTDKAVVSVSLAFSWGRKDPETQKRPTTWVDGTLWGKRAEALEQYLVKGTSVMVSLSEIHTEVYADRDGVERTKLAGRIEQIELAGSSPARAAAPPPPPPKPAPRPSADLDDLDQDIPFATSCPSFDAAGPVTKRMRRYRGI